MTLLFDYVHHDARKLTKPISISAITAAIAELPIVRLDGLERELQVERWVTPNPMKLSPPSRIERAESYVIAAAASGALKTYVRDPAQSDAFCAVSPRVWIGRYAPVAVPEVLVKCCTLIATWGLVPQSNHARRFANQSLFMETREADNIFQLNRPATVEQAREATAAIVRRAEASPLGRLKKREFLSELYSQCGKIAAKLADRMWREEIPPAWRKQGRIPMPS